MSTKYHEKTFLMRHYVEPDFSRKPLEISPEASLENIQACSLLASLRSSHYTIFPEEPQPAKLGCYLFSIP